MVNMDELVLIKIFKERVETEVAKGYLAAKGIESIVRNDDAGGILLFVRKQDQERAFVLLKTKNVA